MSRESFRPLAGISCVRLCRYLLCRVPSFRPLAGISCVQQLAQCKAIYDSFRPLAGISCVEILLDVIAGVDGFRPLAGISCVGIHCIEDSPYTGFRPLAGISCVCKTAQLGPVGFGPGSDRITISHSTAAGKWQLEIKIPLIFLREPLQTAMQVAAMETRFAQSADSH